MYAMLWVRVWLGLVQMLYTLDGKVLSLMAGSTVVNGALASVFILALLPHCSPYKLLYSNVLIVGLATYLHTAYRRVWDQVMKVLLGNDHEISTGQTFPNGEVCKW